MLKQCMLELTSVLLLSPTKKVLKGEKPDIQPEFLSNEIWLQRVLVVMNKL